MFHYISQEPDIKLFITDVCISSSYSSYKWRHLTAPSISLNKCWKKKTLYQNTKEVCMRSYSTAVACMNHHPLCQRLPPVCGNGDTKSHMAIQVLDNRILHKLYVWNCMAFTILWRLSILKISRHFHYQKQYYPCITVSNVLKVLAVYVKIVWFMNIRFVLMVKIIICWPLAALSYQVAERAKHGVESSVYWFIHSYQQSLSFCVYMLHNSHQQVP